MEMNVFRMAIVVAAMCMALVLNMAGFLAFPAMYPLFVIAQRVGQAAKISWPAKAREMA
jgi:hypothetical protein